MSQSTTLPPPLEPAGAPASTRRPMLTASGWGVGAMLLGVTVAVLTMLPFRPDRSHGASTGWEDLGWAVLTLLLAVAGALVLGAVGIAVGLRRRRCPRPVVTALTFMPVALLLGAFTHGLGLLLAPAASVWLVDGLARPAPDRIDDEPSRPPDAGPDRAWRRIVAGGLVQRLVAVVVVSTLLTGWLLRRVGHELGGELHGSWYVWLACLPVLVLVPTVLLWRRTPWHAVAGIVVVSAALAALSVPGAIEGAHPTAAKLSHDVRELGVPDGYRVASSTTALLSAARSRYGYELPVVAVAVVPTDLVGTPPPIPEVFQPSEDGTLPELPPGAARQPLPSATATGHAAAEKLAAWLVAAGWDEDLSASGSRGDTPSTYWLPRRASDVLDAGTSTRLTRGPWVRANIVPLADAALLVVSTRP
jgi:hypothetical protein